MKSYICIVSKLNGDGALGNPRTAALVFRPGLLGYKFIMTKELPDGSLMGIYEVNFSFMAQGAINRVRMQLEADCVLLYDPVTKMINNTPLTDLERLQQIIKSIVSEPALI